MNSNYNYSTQKAVLATIRRLEKIKCKAIAGEIRYNNSCYIDITTPNGREFKIRMSDHNLMEGNFLPAGVIDYSYDIINYAISLSYLKICVKYIESISDDEYEYIQTNRMVYRKANGQLGVMEYEECFNN